MTNRLIPLYNQRRLLYQNRKLISSAFQDNDTALQLELDGGFSN